MGLHVPSVIDVLAEAIRKEILQGGLPAGTQLTEMGVASKYDVARPSAKGALERLSHEGLLRREANRSARVPALTDSDVRDLYASRALIEKAAVSTLALMRPQPLELVRSKLGAMRARAAEQSVIEFVEADGEFHSALLDALGSGRLGRMHGQLMRETQLCKAQVNFGHLQDPAVIVEEHANIIAAVENGDAAGASARMEEHLMNACERLVAAL